MLFFPRQWPSSFARSSERTCRDHIIRATCLCGNWTAKGSSEALETYFDPVAILQLNAVTTAQSESPPRPITSSSRPPAAYISALEIRNANCSHENCSSPPSRARQDTTAAQSRRIVSQASLSSSPPLIHHFNHIINVACNGRPVSVFDIANASLKTPRC
jgi:hypothetical protein